MAASQPQVWLLPPDKLPLARDEVHVWRAALDMPKARVEAFEQTLKTTRPSGSLFAR